MNEYLKRQTDLRASAWEEAKNLLDAAAAESRDLTAEENVIYDRISEDMDNRARVIEQITKDEERAQRLDVAAASVRTDEVAPADEDDTGHLHSVRAESPLEAVAKLAPWLLEQCLDAECELAALRATVAALTAVDRPVATNPGAAP